MLIRSISSERRVRDSSINSEFGSYSESGAKANVHTYITYIESFSATRSARALALLVRRIRISGQRTR